MPLLLFQFSFLLGGIISIILASLIYLSNKKDVVNKTYFGLSFSGGVWCLGFYAMITSNTDDIAYFWRSVMDAGAIILPAFWIHFLYSITNKHTTTRKRVWPYYVFGAILIVINFSDSLWPGLFIKELMAKNVFPYYPSAGTGYYFFVLFYIITIPYSLFYLIRRYFREYELKTGQIQYIILASFVGFVGGSTSFFLTFGIPIPPYGIILFAIYPIIIAYAITKHHLFDIKVISTEIFTAIVWITLFFRTLLSDNLTDQIINGITLSFMTVFGILIIRSVLKEVSQREKIERLAMDLKITNADLAKANEKLKELDKLKSEFLSLASHQIRGPLTAIRGYASEILEGDFGVVPKNLKDPVKVISSSSECLIRIVEDFLNISRIEQGRMKYNIEEFDLSALVKDVVEEWAPAFKEKRLSLNHHIAPKLRVLADSGKVRQVITNLLENGTKYTKEGGVLVNLMKTPEGTALLAVKDTGIGISEKTKGTLFQKFSRAEGASKMNTSGSGLGLYVAMQMLKAQNGKIWVESPGEGFGSTFFVELKLA